MLHTLRSLSRPIIILFYRLNVKSTFIWLEVFHSFSEVNLQSIKHLIKMNDDSLALACEGNPTPFKVMTLM